MRTRPQPPTMSGVVKCGIDGSGTDGIPAITTCGSDFWKEPTARHGDQAQTDITKVQKRTWRIAASNGGQRGPDYNHSERTADAGLTSHPFREWLLKHHIARWMGRKPPLQRRRRRKGATAPLLRAAPCQCRCPAPCRSSMSPCRPCGGAGCTFHSALLHAPALFICAPLAVLLIGGR